MHSTRIFSLGIVLFLALQHPTIAADKMQQKAVPLRSVTVYLNAAELTHQATVSIPEGASTLILGNLSPQANEETLQVAFEKDGITTLSSQFAIEDIAQNNILAVTPQAKESLAAHQRILDRIRKLAADRAAAQETLAGLKAQAAKPADVLFTTTQKLNEFMQYVYEKQKSLTLQLAQLDIDLQAAKLDLQHSKEHLQDLGIGAESTYKRGRVILQVLAKSAVNSTVFVRYLAYGARWQHSYEIRGEADSKQPLKLISRAAIAQNTGLFWDAVKLRLVYGYAQTYQQAPTLLPWTLREFVPQQVVPYARKAMPLMSMSNVVREEDAVDYDSDMGMEEAKVGMLAENDVDVSSNMLNVSYDIKIPYDILPNGREHQIEIQSIEIPAVYSYSAIPKLNSEAFLVATIKNYNNYGLFASPASIIFEKMRAGTTHLSPTNQTNELPITLGAEPRIAIERKSVADKSSDVFLSSNRERVFTYDILVRNNKKEAITIQVKDQYPLSSNENIKVELLESSGAQVDKLKGELSWDLQLAAGEAKTLRLSYKVRYPKNAALNF